MASILLHCCCAPCATYTTQWLREHSFEVTAYWYNPNIHPFTEHQNRFESMKMFADRADLPLIIKEGYEMPEYFRTVAGDEENRCTDCYQMRLGKTAEHARKMGFDAFSTTLLISPYQNQEMLYTIGNSTGLKNDVSFYFQDLRSGYRESQQLAQEFELYRQKYCGCVYSEWERYTKTKVR